MPRTLQHSASMLEARGRALGTALVLAVTLVPAVVATRSTQAQTYSVLHSFTGADGANPHAGLIRDPAGNLYGTTAIGGRGCFVPNGCGTVFKLDTTGTVTVLHNFRGAEGAFPLAGLVRDAAGNLYGTTGEGGDLDCFAPYGCGTVFKLDTAGTLIVLYSFTGKPDGEFPVAGLIRDAAGNLYSTTEAGGAQDHGTVFKLDTTGAETVLHSFTMRPDGESPTAGLVRDAAGNLYGTTKSGGSDFRGTVFKLDATGTETVLYSFSGKDGKFPHAGLILDAAGNLYGTTESGGSRSYGTVFKLDMVGTETVLHSFRRWADGGYVEAGLIRDAAGNLYGTTEFGGPSDRGTVFKVDTAGTHTMLHTFRGPDGMRPLGALVRDAAGNVYGTTAFGGDFGYGTVFKITLQ